MSRDRTAKRPNRMEAHMTNRIESLAHATAALLVTIIGCIAVGVLMLLCAPNH